MTKAEAQARVAKGAALLDTQRPGWAQKINPETFQISSCTNCVLGQLYGGFGEGCTRTFPGASSWEAQSHGFVDFFANSYGELQEAWLEAIAERTAPQVEWTHREEEVLV